MTAINELVYRQTKIIATLGPATSSRDKIEGLIDAGVDLVRLNFSHGDKESHIARAKLVREIAKEKNYHVGIVRIHQARNDIVLFFVLPFYW